MPTERVAVARTTAATAYHQRREVGAVSPFGCKPAQAPDKSPDRERHEQHVAEEARRKKQRRGMQPTSRRQGQRHRLRQTELTKKEETAHQESAPGQRGDPKPRRQIIGENGPSPPNQRGQRGVEGGILCRNRLTWDAGKQKTSAFGQGLGGTPIERVVVIGSELVGRPSCDDDEKESRGQAHQPEDRTGGQHLRPIILVGRRVKASPWPPARRPNHFRILACRRVVCDRTSPIRSGP